MLQKLKLHTVKSISTTEEYKHLNEKQKEAIQVVGSVLPFRVNNYVIENLIDWNNIPEDPIFQLTFMQKDMLDPADYDQVREAIYKENSTPGDIAAAVFDVRLKMNPHPAGQLSANVPKMDDSPVEGVQHKYRETVLVFPSPGQMCHSYCTFCFRWPQFIGDKDLKFTTDKDMRYLDYLKQSKEVTDVLFTGGDPMIMNTKLLKKYIEPLLSDEYDHITNIRIGSKSLTYWPYRYTTDKDAEELMEFFTKINDSGKQLAFMAHINHPNEMKTEVFKEAVSNIRKTGTVIRSQAPLLRNINDSADVWASMWQEQVKLGIIPYYMFVERDTGPKDYFCVPLARAYKIYHEAIQKVSGLARTVRGPSMSAHPGKVCVEGLTEINGEQVFILKMLQSRNPELVNSPFFAKYSESAIWLDDLKPAGGTDNFPFEK